MVEVTFFDESDPANVRVIPFRLDAVPEQQHRMAARATDHEVESGVAVTDHVRPEPRTLTMQAVVSRSSFVDTADTSPTALRDAWAALLDARDRALLGVVVTEIATYEDMVLIEAQSSRAAADGTWLRAELTFRELRIVQTQSVADPVPARARDRRRVDRGAQGTEEAPERLESIAHRGLSGVAELLGI